MEESISQKAKKIKLLMLDVDGVLTDGRIIYDSKGRDLKFFDVHDGMGVYLLKKAGILTLLITAKGSKAIKPRARDMHVEAVFENVSPKTSILAKIMDRYKVKPEQICFVGDDLVDLGLMKKVGFAIAVFNACPEIKQAASYVTLRYGGRGAVREVAESILKSQGRWQEVISSYDA
ncbi:MAG: HAD-IIIA family hydrolase [Candidatus Omnitrophica bacterium]|nr:HAD-IIIA family hydrolase [Candidatus Omnitrophota bacterium]